MDGSRSHDSGARRQSNQQTGAEQEEQVGGGEDIVHLSTCVKIMEVPRHLWSMFSTSGNKAVLQSPYVSKVLKLVTARVPEFAGSRSINGRLGTSFGRPGSRDEISFYMNQDRVLVITALDDAPDDDVPEMNIDDGISRNVIQILEEVSQATQVPPDVAKGARRKSRRKSLRRTRRNK